MYAGERTSDAFSQFELLERRADLAEGHAEALALAAPRTLEEEIAELKSAEQIDAELAALKAGRLAIN
jgi:phage shock protein A